MSLRQAWEWGGWRGDWGAGGARRGCVLCLWGGGGKGAGWVERVGQEPGGAGRCCGGGAGGGKRGHGAMRGMGGGCVGYFLLGGKGWKGAGTACLMGFAEPQGELRWSGTGMGRGITGGGLETRDGWVRG